MTYTVATMEVSKSTYEEIKGKLEAAGYHHAIDTDGILDMTHIGLVQISIPPPVKVHCEECGRHVSIAHKRGCSNA